MEKQTNQVVVIIVVYNGAKWLHKNINSLLQSNVPVSIIVFDNASTDDSVAIIERFPEVKLIQSKRNLGFGRANNEAIAFALQNNYNYYFLLNQDTWVFPDTIFELLKVAENNPDLGIVSPIHYSGDGMTLDANFDMYWNRKTSRTTDYDLVPFVNAAAWLMPKKVIETVGFFETLFPHYGEDRNYVDRLHYHQLKVAIAIKSSICHDRIIKTNYNKIVNQSKLLLLSQVLNVNYSLFSAYFLAAKSIIGLPKYYYLKIGFISSFELFFKLLMYFGYLKLHIFQMNSRRRSYK